MIKIIIIGGLLYTFYRLVFHSKGISSPDREGIKDSDKDDTIDINYEEVD